MAAAAAKPHSIKIWVKGEPKTQTLGDCPFCHRALLALELKHVEYEKEIIDFAHKPKFLFDFSEKGTVPVMKDGEQAVPDSGAIVEYLDKYYEPKLIHADAPNLASKLFPSFVGYLKDESAKEYTPELAAQLQELEEFLSTPGNGPFFGGESMSALDCLLGPRVYHVSVAIPHWKGHAAFDSFPAVAKYLEAFKASEPVKNTYYGPEMIVKGWAAHDGVPKPSSK